MIQFRKLFVVYDPTREEQPALERAVDMAAEGGADVHVFSCTYSDNENSADKSTWATHLLNERQGILDKAVAPLSDRGIKVSTEVEWDRDWCQAAQRASIKCEADLVLKSSYKHSSGARMLNRTSDWTLIRGCLCPVLLVKESEMRETTRVLAAIDICAKTESYERLTQKVIDFGKKLSARGSAEVHIINAFQDFKGVPTRKELKSNTGVEGDRIYIKHGKPEKVIVEHAKKLDVSMVVMGNSTRSGLSGALIGNTVEKVLDKLECDVLSMP